MRALEVRPVVDEDQHWVKRLLIEQWGSTKAVSRGRVHYPMELPGFVALIAKQLQGLITYRIDGDECEIVTLNSTMAGKGIGIELISVVKTVAESAGCKRIWLVTTNDNINALGFYQRRGFSLVAVHCNALGKSRQLKPEIPLVAENGIPIRDEIEFEMIL